MPDFSIPQATIRSAEAAINLLPRIKMAYDLLVSLNEVLVLYQSGTDEVFNAAVDAAFTVAEKQALNDLLGQANMLTTAWATNHWELLGLPEPIVE